MTFAPPIANPNVPMQTFSIPAGNIGVSRDLSLDEVKRKVVSCLSSHPLLSASKAERVEIRQNDASLAYLAKWEAFCETRSSNWETEAYAGQVIDTYYHGLAPNPWEIPIEYPPLFTEKTVEIHVPHTDIIEQCHKCQGSGRIVCDRCNGYGTVKCVHCANMNHNMPNQPQCAYCHGNHFNRCDRCNKEGRVSCVTCKQSGKLVKFIQLKATFTVKKMVEMVSNSSLHSKWIEESTGTELCMMRASRLSKPNLCGNMIVDGIIDKLYSDVVKQVNPSVSPVHQERFTLTQHSVNKVCCKLAETYFDTWIIDGQPIIENLNSIAFKCVIM